jgi:hypothetical protein
VHSVRPSPAWLTLYTNSSLELMENSGLSGWYRSSGEGREASGKHKLGNQHTSHRAC